MSCYMVGKAHIDALVEAGLYAKACSCGSPLRWMVRELTDEDKRESYERGEPWGPRAIELYNELRRELTFETADRTGQMLMRENRLSVDHRYNETEIEEVYAFEHWLHVGKVNPVVILKALACYEYQSCEHPGWKTSEAHAYCEALRGEMIRALPGFDEGPGWEITKRSEYTISPYDKTPQREYTQDEIDSFLSCHPAD